MKFYFVILILCLIVVTSCQQITPIDETDEEDSVDILQQENNALKQKIDSKILLITELENKTQKYYQLMKDCREKNDLQRDTEKVMIEHKNNRIRFAFSKIIDLKDNPVYTSWTVADEGPFLFMMPPELSRKKIQGIDSRVGSFESQDIMVYYDY